MPDCSTPSSSPYPSFLFQIIFYNSPPLRNPSSLNYVFIFYTKSLIIKLFPPDLCASSSHLSSAPLSLSLSLIPSPGLLFRLSSTFLQSLCGGPESSGCSTRMSGSHILTFRQPKGLKGSSRLNQSHPLCTFRKVPQAGTGGEPVSIFTDVFPPPSAVQCDCFMYVWASLTLSFSHFKFHETTRCCVTFNVETIRHPSCSTANLVLKEQTGEMMCAIAIGVARTGNYFFRLKGPQLQTVGGHHAESPDAFLVTPS